jgi:integrase/recombinase XerD
MKDFRNYLKPAEIDRLLDNTDNLRDYLIIRLLWKTGIRVSELTSLEVNWIDYEEKMITIFGKGSKWRRTPIDRESLMHLKRYIKDINCKDDIIFPLTRNRIFQIIRVTSDRAGINKKIHPHTLRHSYAINYLMKGGNLRNLQLNLGHSDLNITAKYLQVTAQDRKEEYEKIFSID